MLILGIDDAGRGPLIGPMVLAGALLTSDQEKILKENNVRDSKTVTQPARVRMAKLIKENSVAHEIVQSSPEEIDNSLNSGTNLNTLEAIKTAKIINTLNNPKEEITVIVDCPSTNTTAWQATLLTFVEHKENLTVKCEHKADANHISAAAGSILAKTTREEEMAKLRSKYGRLGSGYPADPDTKDFLRKRGKEFKDAGIFRKTWATWKKLYPEKDQSTLEGF